MHLFLSFEEDYITATEIKQVQSFCIIYTYIFRIIMHKHVHGIEIHSSPCWGHSYKSCPKSYQIFTAFQKVPNLFSFMLHSATRCNFSLFSNTSLSFPPQKKKKSLAPNIPLMSYKHVWKSVARSWLCSSPLASPLLLPYMPVSSSTFSCSSGAGVGVYRGFKHPWV